MTMDKFSIRHALTGCLAATLLMTAVPGIAQAATDGELTVAVLQKELEKRDAIIIELLRRVQALEEGRVADRQAAAPAEDGMAGTPAPVTADYRATSRDADPADALRAARALERGLVQEGALLLAPGQVEIAPAVYFTHLDDRYPTTVLQGADPVVGRLERSIDASEWLTDLRIGLPFDAQLEIGVPYRAVEQQFDVAVDGSVVSRAEESGAGLGDVTLGLAKVLAAQRGWRPQLTARLRWLTGSGDEADGGVALGGGLSGLGGRLGAYWRRDPVVFLVSGGYLHYQRDGALQPGDRYDLSLGTGLAISPETALLLSLEQGVARQYQRDGQQLPGTDRLTTVLDLSASTLLGPRLNLRVSTGVGLSGDSPDYRLGVALSSRFDLR